ncbi:MAG: hypothetical protein ACI9PY_000976 [Ascidiaceihabitans sp.]|jgi:hypothetical protein
MTGQIPDTWPNGAVIRNRAGRTMDIILHLGAHRTGSTTFQSYMTRNKTALRTDGVEFWGPLRTRAGLFAGIQPNGGPCHGRNTHARAHGRIRMQLDKAAQSGVKTLIVSDENMIGSVRSNLRTRSLYPAIGERIARFAPAFGGRITRVVLNTRAQDLYWASCAAYGVSRGHPMLRAIAFEAMTASARTWRDVIADLSCAVDGVDVAVLPFERFAGRPDAMLRAITGGGAPKNGADEWLNRAPNTAVLREILQSRSIKAPELDGVTGRWRPFDAAQSAALREDYADDMFWLTAGADGLATLTEDIAQPRAGQTRAGTIPPAGAIQKGHRHDFQERHLAQPG